MTKEETPKVETSGPNSVFMLTETYRHWAMRMNVDLEAQGLMKLIEGNRKNTQKDYLVLSMILHSLWNLKAPSLTSRRVPQRIGNSPNTPCGVILCGAIRVQPLMKKIENLSMKKNEKVGENSSRFVRVVYKLRDLGEKLEDRETVPKLHRSAPK